MATPSVDGFPKDLSPDHYTVERELGRGGMATVYVVRDTKHGRRVALKVLRPDLATNLGAERFRREITLAASLQHPHIVPVHDSGETPSGTLWFTMPLIEGESLRDKLRRQHQLSVEEAVRITREVALALDYAHRHGVIHRDIKPENILLVEGQPLVADFGIARAMAAATPGDTLTATGMAVGTPAYMSPEQAAGERALDPATDIYSLGAVCYEMLTGEPPFPGPTAQAIAAKMRSGEVPPIRRVRPSVPEWLDEVVGKALAPVPADRYATAGDLARALETTERAAFASRGRISAPRRWPTLPLAAAGIGVAVMVALVLFWRSRQVSLSAAGAPVRIAVLPFDNLGDTADAYFADGVTDAVRGKLTAVPGLEVTAPVSSGQYRHTNKTPQQIGRELGVRYLVIGRIRWAKGAAGASRVQVNPALIDAATAADKWEAPFDAPITDVFQVQADIAARVVKELQVALTPNAAQAIARQPTRNLDAYNAYLRGRAIEETRSAYDPNAAAAYREAVKLDSTFSLAWAALALTTTGDSATAHNAWLRALALTPDLPEAHAAAGYFYFFNFLDATRALAEFQTALRLDPSNASVLTRVAHVEWSTARYDSSLVHRERAAQLDPRNANAIAGLCEGYRGFARYGDAEPTCDRAIALQPANLNAVRDRIYLSLEQGDLSGARAVLHAALTTIDSATMALHLAEYNETGWVMDGPLEQVLLRQRTSSQTPDDRAPLFCALAQQYGYHGDSVRARVAADTAAALYASELREVATGKRTPSRLALANLRAFYGLSLAYAGRRDSALAEAKAAVAVYPGPDEWYFRYQLLKVYLLLDRPSDALDLLAFAISQPDAQSTGSLLNPVYTPQFFRIDANLNRLHGNPRFEALTLCTPFRGMNPSAFRGLDSVRIASARAGVCKGRA